VAKKWSKDVRIYFGGYDPGTHTTRHAVGLVVNPLDPTSYGDNAEKVLAGERSDTFEWAGWFDDSAGGLDVGAAALLGSGTKNVVSVLYGTGTGDLVHAGTGYLIAAQPAARIGELVRMEAEFKPDQKWDQSLLQIHRLAQSHGGTYGDIDHGAASTAGYSWYVHVHDYTGTGTVTQQLQDSPDGTTYTVRQSFLATTTRDAVKITVGSGTSLAQHTRLSPIASPTADIVTMSCWLHRE